MRRAVFVGYDPRLDMQYRVCRASLQHHCPHMEVVPLKLDALYRAGLVRRWSYKDARGQMYDAIDGRPVSTEFTYSRFAVPLLAELMGVKRALFCDCDFLWRASVDELFALADGDRPVWCVHHDYEPTETTKIDGVEQHRYPRKNWSSLMLFDVEHSGLRTLTHWKIATLEGRRLHAFDWLHEPPGELPQEWNWLEGWSTTENPKAVHYTRGTPDMPGHEDAPYAEEWWDYASRLTS